MSRVRACRLVGLNRSSLNYQSKRPDDATVRQRLRELAAERRRFGYRRLGWLLAREGHVMNRKKLYRIYRKEKLMVRRRGRRKRAIGMRAPLALPDTINRRWSLDFVSDALSDGRRFRIFCVVDDFSPRMPGHGGRYLDWRRARGARTEAPGDGTRRAQSDRQR